MKNLFGIKLSNVRIAGKLCLLILPVMAGVVAMTIINLCQMDRIFDSASYATVNTVPSFNSIYKVRNSLRKIQIDTLYHVLNTENEKMTVLDNEIHGQREAMSKEFDFYEKNMISNDEDKLHLDAVRAAVKDYFALLDVTLALSRQNRNAEARTSAENNRKINVVKVEQALLNHVAFNEKLAKAGAEKALSIKNKSFWTSVIIVALLLMLTSVFGWVIVRSELAEPIGKVVDNLQHLANGEMNVMIAGVERRDEVGDIARAAQVFKEFALNLDTQSWVKSHLSEVSAKLQQAEDYTGFSQGLLSKICPLLNVGHGVMYLKSDETLRWLGSYGCRDGNDRNRQFAIGEGLAGQCALEKSPITLTDVPSDYIKIGSGLGDAAPNCLVLLPIIHTGNVLGVLEIASFQPFSKKEMALLEALLPVIAMSMEILGKKIYAEKMMDETMNRAVQMETQAAQLEEQTVELEAQQSELLKTEAWYRAILHTAEAMLVVDEHGAIILSNSKSEAIFGCQTGELTGQHVEKLIPAWANSKPVASIQTKLEAVSKDGRSLAIKVTLNKLPAIGDRGACACLTVQA